VRDIEDAVNIGRGRLTGMLKVLEVEGAVEKDGARYRRTTASWAYPQERIERVTELRRAEQAIMREYLDSEQCLMELLGRALDDPDAAACGRCARCTGTSVAVELDRALVVRAQEYLRREPLTIDPRKMDARGKRIPSDLLIEPGRALCHWGDGGWGGLVREGTRAGAFPDELVTATVRMIRQWDPAPRPAWVTCVPSWRAPELVPSFAARLARELRLPFVPCVVKRRETAPQREMQNSAQQVRNVDGAFAVEGSVPDGAVLLVDDTVGSRWTLTVVGGQLRAAGSGPVLPVALAAAPAD
jgi:ATP-dependent DNA helicase RecQ